MLAFNEKEKVTNKTKEDLMLREIKLLRSAIIGWVGKDPEGLYDSKFVKQVLKNCQEKDEYTFKDKKSFLKSLNLKI
ncbi:MAG: hypothetical protein U9N04_02860 [Patescibacteria group bacterium]|nr:hypothetical protein [Patescibacteria group bacterium]